MSGRKKKSATEVEEPSSSGNDESRWFDLALRWIAGVAPTNRKRGVVYAVIMLALAGGQYLVRHPSYLSELQFAAPAAAKLSDRFAQPQTLYVVYRNPDGTVDGAPEKWLLTIHGNETLTGQLELAKQHATGVLTGYIRAGVAVITYASTDPSRPGFGTFYLTPRNPVDSRMGTVWAGIAVVHDCATASGVVCSTLKVVSAPAMMSDQSDNVDDPNNEYYKAYKDVILAGHLGMTPAESASTPQASQTPPAPTTGKP
jgi:hypothetical protein